MTCYRTLREEVAYDEISERGNDSSNWLDDVYDNLLDIAGPRYTWLAKKIYKECPIYELDNAEKRLIEAIDEYENN